LPSSGQFTLTGSVYREAAPAISPINAFVHVKDPGSIALAVGNSDPADGFSENLIASITAAGGSIGATIGATTGEIAAGSSSNALALTFSTAQAGVDNGSVTLALTSDGGVGQGSIDGLGQVALASQLVAVSITVDNFASAALEKVSGAGTFGGSAAAGYTLDLGTVSFGATGPTVNLGALNAALGPSDLLKGSFVIGGPNASAFTNSNLGAFSGLDAGQADTSPVVTLNTSAVGTFTETITLDATGYNAGGFSGALTAETLTITGTVDTPPQANSKSYAAVPFQTPTVSGFTSNQVTGNVLTDTNDADANHILTGAAIVNGPAHGSLSFVTQTTGSAQAGSFVYTPYLGYVGADSFAYNSIDSYGTASSSPGTISFTVGDAAKTFDITQQKAPNVAWTVNLAAGYAANGTTGLQRLTGVNNVITGNGNNTITGNSNNDVLIGGSGNDVIHGGIGNDIIAGGDGINTLYGGGGSNVFVFAPGNSFKDTVADFNVAKDVMDFEGFGSIAQITGHMAALGSTSSLITLTPNETIQINGVTPGQLLAAQAGSHQPFMINK
jgi:Ca2+-binding RTX toxin-like protein